MILLAAAASAHFTQDPTFWVGLALAALLLIFWKMGVHRTLGKSLDDRSAAIKTELDEARRLKDEAQKLLEEYKAKRDEADNEAKIILDNAQRDAEALAVETRRSLKETIERRTKLAEEKIARAEAQAVSEVRATAVDAAVAAAETIVGAKTTGVQGTSLIDQGIRDLKKHLN